MFIKSYLHLKDEVGVLEIKDKNRFRFIETEPQLSLLKINESF